MKEGLNSVTLAGNLGADPELKYTTSGQAVLNLRMAVTTSYVDREKVRQEKTLWVNVEVWGPRGEALSKLLHKGEGVLIAGELDIRSYDDRDGNKRQATSIRARDVVLCGGRAGAGEDAGERPAAPARGTGPGRSAGRPARGFDEPADDLPDF